MKKLIIYGVLLTLLISMFTGCSNTADKEQIEQLTADLEQVQSGLADTLLEVAEMNNLINDTLAEIETTQELIAEAEQRIVDLEKMITDLEEAKTVYGEEQRIAEQSAGQSNNSSSSNNSLSSGGTPVWTPPEGFQTPGFVGDDGKTKEGGIISGGNMPGDENVVVR